MWKKRLFYLVLLVYSTILAILYNVYSTGLAAVLLWLLPFVLFLFLAAGQLFIKVSPLPVKELVKKGEMLETGFLVENRSFLPGFPGRMLLEVREGFGGSHYKIKKQVILKGHRRVKISVPVETKYCGRLEIVYQGFWLSDYFGLFSFRKSRKEMTSALVLPKLVELTGGYRPLRDAFEEEEERFSETKPGDDVSEIFGFHEYRPGDRLRGIHWKLSSKKETLIVKEFSLPMTVKTGIWLDFQKNPLSEEETEVLDKALTALFSLSMALLQREVSHYIYFAGERFLIEGEEEITMVFDVIYARGFGQEMQPLERPVPNLFYIGQEKNKEKLLQNSREQIQLWMVDTERIERILEDIYG